MPPNIDNRYFFRIDFTLLFIIVHISLNVFYNFNSVNPCSSRKYNNPEYVLAIYWGGNFPITKL